MRSTILSFNFTTSDYTASFPYPLQLDPLASYEASLLSMETYNTLFNITEKNNKFSYNPGSGYKTITVSPGAYEISQISSEVSRLMKEQGDEPKNMVIDIQKHTSKSTIKLKNNYKVDFTIENSFRELLGFSSKKIETNGTFYSDNVIQISSGINSVLIHCDLIDGAYNDGIRTNTIFSFSAYSTPIGYKFNMEPKNLVYLPVSGKTIYRVNFRITDQDNRMISFNDEIISIRIHLREVFQ